jgi:hypothetical protein
VIFRNGKLRRLKLSADFVRRRNELRPLYGQNPQLRSIYLTSRIGRFTGGYAVETSNDD